MRFRDDPDIEVPDRCKVAWQLAAERAGLTLRAWLVTMGDEIRGVVELPVTDNAAQFKRGETVSL